MHAQKLKIGDCVEVLVGPPYEIARRLEFLQELEDFRKHREKPQNILPKDHLL